MAREVMFGIAYSAAPLEEVHSFLEALHQAAPDEATDDRILEVANFVAGFCSSHLKVWDV